MLHAPVIKIPGGAITVISPKYPENFWEIKLSLNPKYHLPRNMHNVNDKLITCVSGMGTITINNKEIVLEPGIVVLVKSGNYYFINNTGEKIMECILRSHNFLTLSGGQNAAIDMVFYEKSLNEKFKPIFCKIREESIIFRHKLKSMQILVFKS